jgi:anti-anti-sigma regulatory factor
MLRITLLENAESLTFRLEGRLAGPWVRELEACWQSTLVSHAQSALRFDLTGVTFVDSAGKAFLAARHAQGAELIASGCLMRAVVAEITAAPIPDCGCPESERELPG